jgi:4-hydroxy-tetrahydrodipicolinate reductase
MTIIKIGMCGATGRMGSAISELIHKRANEFTLAAEFSSSSSKESLLEFCKKSDVIIDFSHPNILKSLTIAACDSKTPILVGTTGLSEKHLGYLKKLSEYVPVLYAPNTSIGSNLIAMLAARVSKILNEYDIEIIEAHHRYKKDAPSGTALMIGQKIAYAQGINFNEAAVFDRASKGSRKAGEIGFSSIRGGGIYGEHEIIFAGDNELVTIGCRALSREVFAEGALFAARLLIKKKIGLYNMEDILNVVVDN